MPVVTVLQVILAALIVLIVWAMCAVMHWDVREECDWQAGLDVYDWSDDANADAGAGEAGGLHRVRGAHDASAVSAPGGSEGLLRDLPRSASAARSEAPAVARAYDWQREKALAEGRAWAREDAADEVWDDECRGGAMPRDGQLLPPSRATGATLGDRAIVARERARSVTDAPRPFDREKAL